MEVFLLQLFIFFVTSAIAVPIAKKLGLSSVLGYLSAGIVIGPFGISLIADVESVMHITEFGVVMMLFLVGLELKPSMLWQMRMPILGTGGAQVIVTALVIGSVTFLVLPWQQALAVGLTLALSSTAIIVQILRENQMMNTTAGRSIFSVLLLQDLAFIPILALMPFLATDLSQEASHSKTLFIDISQFSGTSQFIIILASLLIVFVVGKYVSRPLFRVIAQTHVREIFVGAALAMVVGISLLMTIVGLSPALGTFIAGVVLADNEYRHELESDIEPFKGLLLGVFFISIGASLNFKLIGDNMLMIVGIAFGLILIKFVILLLVAYVFKVAKKNRIIFAVSLAQGGEFAFVLFQFAKTNGVLGAEITDPFISAVVISMFLAPLLFKVSEKFLYSRKTEENNQQMDVIDEKGKQVILAGFGQLGMDIGRFLISAGVKPIILDNNAAKVDVLRKFGFEVYYGDVTRLDLLKAAGAPEAELLILTMRDVEITKKLVDIVQKHYPNLKIVANASDLEATYELMDIHVDKIRRESFGSALMLGQDILQLLGMDPYDAYRLMRIFRKHNEDMVQELYKRHQEDMDSYISVYQQQMENLEELMTFDLDMDSDVLDKAWKSASPEE